jgi:hypothetical protein
VCGVDPPPIRTFHHFSKVGNQIPEAERFERLNFILDVTFLASIQYWADIEINVSRYNKSENQNLF